MHGKKENCWQHKQNNKTNSWAKSIVSPVGLEQQLIEMKSKRGAKSKRERGKEKGEKH